MAHDSDAAAAVQIGQVLLRFQYQALARRPGPLPGFSDVEFRCYSQNGEDGILLYLFSLLGTTNRRVVEICAGSGIECNAANLLINHGWHGLLVDGDPAQIAMGKEFYGQCKTTWLQPPVLAASWVTAESVNRLVRDHGFDGELDLLSLDIDGNDYWIWRALDCISPRVVVLEFNTAFGPERSVTLPYQPDFRLDYNDRPYRCGASLPAFVKLGRQKGYRLVGVQSLGFNAFFVRSGLGEDLLPERSAGECYAASGPLRAWRPTWVESMYRDGQQWDEV
jgi:hypothetical protein